MQDFRILLVDDSPLFLEAARVVFADAPDIKIIGTASSGLDALECVRILEPDLVLMDLSMPGMNGLQAARSMIGLTSRPWVIIMTAYDDDQYREIANVIGVDGFIQKSEMVLELLPLIRKFVSVSGMVDCRDDRPNLQMSSRLSTEGSVL